MAKYTLRDGESRRIGSDGILRVEAFEMGSGGASMELAIVGEGVDAVRVHDLSLMVHSLPERATIVVQPKRGGTFGQRSEVRLTVSNAGDSVTFPRVLIDAAEDSPERLAEVTPESGSYRLDAFGTTEGAGITDSAREVRSKMRRAELDASGLDDVTVIVDGSASMQVNVTPKIVEAAAKYIDALSDAFKRFRATDGQDSIQTHKVDELTRFISGVIENGAERVGQRPWHGPNIVSTSSLAIYVTDSPVASMVDTGVPTVVLITSAIGRQELELAHINGTPRQVAYAVIDEDVVKQLDSGANTELSELTDRVTAMLKERNS
ncbi:hypothetical protein [Corynebacterium minutissimum]|uniref:Uncharacterized protein n=1 Tax=Corynebacterium minutissimum TaxID=38301 RepID=A0A2X4RG55_9CORY|nr:hypothetical protein [Corynebacterium minutissimum]KHO30563.1 hypothetical protein NX84_02035 [Corynebacterium minutissimum]MCG7229696.1 hypothetical protein [Corynebacterium minutissimum]MCG7237544.1 hypothetical protein [Corynebacterium minutissimum]QPS60125.1 hypothetical protein I6G51_02655 [Corynebacterium minutissimum]QQA79085.1 hypothetical protein I6H49_10190 [Corynebacterium minutissimum]